jgi:serine protease Do
MSLFDRLRSQKALSFTLVLFTLSVGIVIGTLINQGVKAARSDGQVAPGATPLEIPNAVELSNSFSQLAKQVGPAVVNIKTEYLPKTPARPRGNNGRRQAIPNNPDDEDNNSGGMQDFFYRFFGDGGGLDMQPQQRRGEATGTGVVVDKAGYILTNNHVVDKADRIRVKFHNDPTEYDAKVIGVDAPTDLAVIRIEGKSNLVAAKIGNSDAVQVGDWAIAIGSPFGYQATVTAGIISAKEREVDPSMQFQHFLQTDAAINPGNSGGPLLNIRGEVIGINTAIATRNGGYQGIGFALPMNTAASVYNQIIKNGKVTRGSIGVKFTPSDTDRARSSLKVAGASQGVFVEQVVPGGPSDKAGMKEEDVIVAVNGNPIQDGNQLVGIVSNTPLGNTVAITVLRDGKRHDLKVVVADLTHVFPEQYGNGKEDSTKEVEPTSVKFGMQIQNLTEQQTTRLGIKQKGGVQVKSIEPGSFAEEIGLQPGDVIVGANRVPVSSTEDIAKFATQHKPGDAVQFRVLSKTGNNEWTPHYVAGTLRANQ